MLSLAGVGGGAGGALWETNGSSVSESRRKRRES